MFTKNISVLAVIIALCFTAAVTQDTGLFPHYRQEEPSQDQFSSYVHHEAQEQINQMAQPQNSQQEEVPAQAPNMPEEDTSFESLLNEIGKHEVRHPSHHESRHHGNRGQNNNQKDQKRGHPSQHGTESEEVETQNLSESYYPGQNEEESSHSRRSHHKKFKKAGKVICRVLVGFILFTSVLCCVRRIKQRRQARKQARMSFQQTSVISQPDSFNGLPVGTPIQVPQQNGMVYQVQGQPIQQNHIPSGQVGYYMIPSQIPYPKLSNNPQFMQIEIPTLNVPQNQKQISEPHQNQQPVNFSRYPVLNPQEASVLQQQVGQQQPFVAMNQPQIPYGMPIYH